MRAAVFLLLVLWGHQLPAQVNSDRREVAKRKIKTATATYLDDYSDTVYHRYSYDEKGRLIQDRRWSRPASCMYWTDKGPIRIYNVLQDLHAETDVRNADGTLYSQANDSLSYLQIVCTWKNFYHRNGSLHYRTWQNSLTGKSGRTDDSPDIHPPEPFDSLEELLKTGNVTYEYYQ